MVLSASTVKRTDDSFNFL